MLEPENFSKTCALIKWLEQSTTFNRVLSHLSGKMPTSNSVSQCVAWPNFIPSPNFYSLLWFDTDETLGSNKNPWVLANSWEQAASLHRKLPAKLSHSAPKQTLVASPNFLAQFPFISVNFWTWRNLQFLTLVHWLCWTPSIVWTCLTLTCKFCFSSWDLIFPLNLLTCFRTVDAYFERLISIFKHLTKKKGEAYILGSSHVSQKKSQPVTSAFCTHLQQ